MHTYPFADVLGLLADGLGVADGVIGDGREQLLLILSVKRGLTHQHLVQQHTISPPLRQRVKIRKSVHNVKLKMKYIE